MRSRHSRNALLVSVFMFAAPIALACSHCMKDILSPAEFDRRAWEFADRVFIGVVTAASAAQRNEFTLAVEYRLHVEEVFKGSAEPFDGRVHTNHAVPEPDTGLTPITCGETLIDVDDKLLVFASSERAIGVGRCSSTHVIEGQSALPADEVRKTLARMRRWAR